MASNNAVFNGVSNGFSDMTGDFALRPLDDFAKITTDPDYQRRTIEIRREYSKALQPLLDLMKDRVFQMSDNILDSLVEKVLDRLDKNDDLIIEKYEFLAAMLPGQDFASLDAPQEVVLSDEENDDDEYEYEEETGEHGATDGGTPPPTQSIK